MGCRGTGRRRYTTRCAAAHERATQERHRLRVVQVDVDDRRDVADKLGVRAAPTLVLVRGNDMIARIEGRASAPRIEAMLEQHLGEAAAAA